MTYQFRLREEPFEFESDFVTELSDTEWESEVNRSSRDYIKWVQTSLNRSMGLRLPMDGIASPQTRSAIRDFQRRERLPVNGIVGPETKQALMAARGRRAASPQDSEAFTKFEFDWPPEWSGELELESVGTISGTDYIKWVQRSLNRRYKVDLPIDGKISGKYREAVRRFNLEYLGRDDDRVDEQTQNQLISANEGIGDYGEWVIKALNKIGFGPLAVTREFDTPHVKAIKAFQASVKPKIKVDGYVGAKTELVLIEASGLKPPSAPKPKPPVKLEPTWSLDDVEAWKIKKHYGQEILDWAKVPPDGTEAKEFAPPSALRGHYKTIFAWKSNDPRKTCLPNPRQSLQLLVVLRDDKAYWDARTGGSRIASEALRTAAATAIRDYRQFIVERKMCPRAAYNRLVAIGKDVTYQMFLGMYQLLASKGVPNRFPQHTQAFAKAIDQIIKRITKQD